MKDIKDKVLVIADIAKSCPDNLQAVCFETLLKHFLGTLTTVPDKRKTDEAAKIQQRADATEVTTGTEDQQNKQEDLKDADLHMKAKRFMEKDGVTLEQLNNLFYKEGDKILPLFDNLKSTRMAESQIRITLLQSLLKAIATGEFETRVEDVRAECVLRKCYDSPNFTANFRNSKPLFDFVKFDKNSKTLRLSDSGKKQLATVVKELQ